MGDILAKVAYNKAKTISNNFSQGSENQSGFKISIIDDDGSTTFLTQLKPLLTARSMVCDLAVNIGYVDDGVTENKLSGAQLSTLQTEGYGILNHGWEHDAPATLTDAELATNYASEKTKFELLGFANYDYYVYPGVMTTGNLTLKNKLKKYYKCNICNTGAPYNNYALDLMELNRGALPLTAPNLDTATAYLNKCYREGLWAILFIHSSNIVDNQYIEDLLDIIVANGWTITPTKTVIDNYTNVIELGNKGGSHFFLDENGNASFSESNPKIIFDDTIRASIVNYRPNCVTEQIVAYNSIADMPVVETGTLETHRFGNYDTDRYAFQTFKTFNTNDQWFRRLDTDAVTWLPWIKYDMTIEKSTRQFEIFDDFIYQTLTAADTPWLIFEGDNGSAVLPAIANSERGVVKLTAGADANGLLVQNGSQIICAIPVQADSVGLMVEARLMINNIANCSLNFGLTDANTLEEPFEIFGGSCTFQATGDTVTDNSHGLENGDKVIFKTIVTTTGIVINTQYFVVNKDANTFQVSTTSGGSALTLTTDGSGTYDAIRSNASDAVCFVYDTGATTQEWFACAVDSDLDDTGMTTVGVAPTSGVYQVLRIEVSNSGNTVRFYIGGTLVKTLTNAGISASTNLYATVCINSTSISRYSYVDYILIQHNRS